MVPFMPIRSLIAVLTLALSAGAASAADPYFQGRTVSILVGYAAGGGADISARTFASYLGKHIAGAPNVIVQNVPGASSTIAHNQIFEVAKGDGQTLLYGPWFPVAQILQMPGVRFRYQDFGLVGMFTATGYVLYARNDAVASPAAIATSKDIRFAGGSQFSNFDLLGSIGLKLFGANYRHITGYRGSADYRSAVLKNEANAAVDTTDVYRTVLTDTLFKPGTAKVLWSYPDRTSDGKWVRNPTLPEVPHIIEVYREAFGKEATGPYAEMLELMSGLRGSTHIVLAPPSTSKEILAELRKGFDGVLADSEYREYYQKRFGSLPLPVELAEAEAATHSLVKLDPKRIDLLKAHVDSIGK
jgi:tripartite-type tricarboxylate transporter receptor subunit TctC